MPACCATLGTLAKANKVIAANRVGLLKALFKQLTGSLLLRPTGIQFAAIHNDCFPMSCLLQIEDLGFCQRGETPAFLRETDMTTTGTLPVNTHGGLLAHSYLLGIEHVLEAVRQLRGESGAAQVAGAQVGMVSGLSMPDFGVLLLGKL